MNSNQAPRQIEAAVQLDEEMKQMESEIVYRGYSRAELRKAFERVQDKTNWKNPIDVTLPYLKPSERSLIHAAVVFFAGCEPTFEVLNTRQHRVRAVGYYAAVGA